MPDTLRIRLGTRASALAQWQANWVAARLEELGVEVEMVPITTSGDRRQQGPIGAIGSQGVFTKEIQRALLDNAADLAVHSLKDLPTDEVPGLCLAAVPQFILAAYDYTNDSGWYRPTLEWALSHRALTMIIMIVLSDRLRRAGKYRPRARP